MENKNEYLFNLVVTFAKAQAAYYLKRSRELQKKALESRYNLTEYFRSVDKLEEYIQVLVVAHDFSMEYNEVLDKITAEMEKDTKEAKKRKKEKQHD